MNEPQETPTAPEPASVADETPVRLWPEWAGTVAPRDAVKHPGLTARFIERLTDVAREVVQGEVIGDLAADRTARIREAMGRAARNLEEHRRFARWLDLLFEAGNKSGRWKASFPTTPALLPRQHPVVVHSDFQLLGHFREIESAFLSTLVQGGISPENLGHAWLLSGIMFGGNFSPARVRYLLAGRPLTIRAAKGLAWIPMETESGTANAATITWYPDALTTALIAKAAETASDGDLHLCAPHYPVGTERLWNSWAKKFLARLGLPHWLHTTRDFLRAAEVSTRLELPGYEAAYLAGEFVSHPLPEQVQARLAGWKIEKPIPAETDDRPRTRQDLMTFSTSGDKRMSVASQLAVLGSVSRILRNSKKPIRGLDELQATHAGKLWPITDALLEWAKWLLGFHGGQRRKVARSTALTYLDLIARRLIVIVEDDDLFDYGPEDFESLYELAAEHVRSDAQRARYWGRVRLFHDFLFLCGAPDLDLRELDGYVSSAGQRVSANLVSKKEFERFKESLTKGIKVTGSREHKMILLAGILGYRLGLRRRETQMIHLRDFHPGPQPYLLVRPSRLAALKTFSAQRQLPLAVLMPADELEFMKSFVANRRNEDGEHPGLLFADIGEPGAPLSPARLFDPVTDWFTAICGTGSGPFRFHYLRHSFANWLLIALLASDERDLVARPPPFIDSALFEPDQLRRIREGLFPRLAGTEDPPGRRHLYQVAALMGHLSPETTLKSYLHLVDWIAGRRLDLALKRTLASWSPGDLAAACGLSHAMAYRPPYRDPTRDPVAFLRRFAASRLPRSIEMQVDPNAGKSDLTPVFQNLRPVETPSVLAVMTLLKRYYADAKIPWLSKVFSIPPSAIRTAINAYEALYAKRSTPKTKKSFMPPYEPRIAVDRNEFWRIVEACESSFADSKKRPDLVAAAEMLVHRDGPRTGNMPMGRDFTRADAVVRGLACMGLKVGDMALIISKHAKGLASTPKPNPSMVKILADLGLSIRNEVKDWEEHRIAEAHIRIVIEVHRKTDDDKEAWWGGRVAGLNFGAVWVAVAIETLQGQKPSD